MNASDPDGSVSRVGFYLGSELLVEDDQAPFVLRLDNLAAGDHRITVRAHDSVGAVGDSAPVEIRVLPVGGGMNQNPVIAQISAQTTVQGQELRFSVQASDQDTPPQKLTYALVAGAPAGAAIDADSGVFSWTPSTVQGPGTFVITVMVSDSASPPGSAQRSFQVTVDKAPDGGTNRVPQLAGIPNQTIAQGSALTFTAAATDEDGQPLTFSLEPGAPVGATIDPLTGAFRWTPTSSQGPGTFVVGISVRDNGEPSLKDTKNVLITVNERIIVIRPSITLHISRLPNKLVELRIVGGDINDIIQIEAAPILGSWVPIATLVKTNPTLQFVDPESSASQSRFYRARIIKLN